MPCPFSDPGQFLVLQLDLYIVRQWLALRVAHLHCRFFTIVGLLVEATVHEGEHRLEFSCILVFIGCWFVTYENDWRYVCPGTSPVRPLLPIGLPHPLSNSHVFVLNDQRDSSHLHVICQRQ